MSECLWRKCLKAGHDFHTLTYPQYNFSHTFTDSHRPTSGGLHPNHVCTTSNNWVNLVCSHLPPLPSWLTAHMRDMNSCQHDLLCGVWCVLLKVLSSQQQAASNWPITTPSTLNQVSSACADWVGCWFVASLIDVEVGMDVEPLIIIM